MISEQHASAFAVMFVARLFAACGRVALGQMRGPALSLWLWPAALKEQRAWWPAAADVVRGPVTPRRKSARATSRTRLWLCSRNVL